MNARIFYHLNSHKIFFWLFVVAFVFQIIFWSETEKIKPRLDIVPPAPSKYFTSATSFGDKEFLFRALGSQLQNFGDVFAGFVSLKNYDYSRIYDWMKALDNLNDKSNFVPSLASYYYSQTQKKEDSRYVVDYLAQHSRKNIDEKWWWMMQAVFIAKSQLKDLNLARDLSYELSENNAKNAPLWTKQMPAFISEELGDGCSAFLVIENLIKESESGERQITAEEMNFMRYFINTRLQKLKTQGFDPKKCQKN
jgi:hypothetical protein